MRAASCHGNRCTVHITACPNVPGLYNVCLSVHMSGKCCSTPSPPLYRLFVLVNRCCNESMKAHMNFSVELTEKGEQEKDAEGDGHDTNDDGEGHTTLMCYCWGKYRDSMS